MGSVPPPSGRAGGAHLWSRQIKTGTPVHLAIHCAAVNSGGDVLIVGRFGTWLDLADLGGPVLPGEPGQVFVLKLGPAGELLWVDRLAGAVGERWQWALAADREGGCDLAAQNDEGGILMKLAPSGARVWSRRLSSMVSQARDGQPLGLAVDTAGNLFAFGHGCAETAVQPPSSVLACLFLLKLDPSGTLLWHRRFPCTGRALRPRVAVDAQGSAFVSGYFQGWLDLAGNELRTAPSWDVYLAKFDTSGNLAWTKHLDGANASDITAGMDAAGNVVLGGAFEREIARVGEPLRSDETRALFLATLDPAGAPRRARHYPGDAQSRFDVNLAVAEDGGALMAGAFAGRLDLGRAVLRSAHASEDLFIAKLDTGGDHAWSRCIQGPSHQLGMTVHAAPDGGAVIIGSFRGSVDFGGALLRNHDAHMDLFVTRLAGVTGTEGR